VTQELLTLHFDALPPSATAQQKGVFVRNGRAHFFTKAKVRQQEQNTVALVLSALPKGWKPLEGPLSLRLCFCFPYRKTERKSVVRSGIEIPHDRRPDLDNLLKGCLDSLTTAGAWLDDGAVACYREIRKVWGPRPYWEVGIARAESAASPASSPRPALGYQEEFKLM